MFNVRKCPKCGGNVPEGNEICNNCGNKMSFFAKNGVIVTTSKNANTIPGGNPFESKKNNNSGCLVFFFIALFFILPIVSVFYEFYQEFSYEYSEPDIYDEYTCSSLCSYDTYTQNGEFCMCSSGDIYNENSGMKIVDKNTKCTIYCDDNTSYYDGNKCVCSNESFIDLNGNEITNSRTVSEWYTDVVSGIDVVTVLCDSESKYCTDYKTDMDDLASRKEFNYYYFNLDALTESEKETLTKTYTLYYYESSDHFVPYLFVIRDNKFTYQLPGIPSIEYIESFLIQHNVIKE